MTIWIARVDWNHNPNTGRPQQGYTVLMPTRQSAEKRVLECIESVVEAAVTGPLMAEHRTAVRTEGSMIVAAEKFDYRVTMHEGSLMFPGMRVKEA